MQHISSGDPDDYVICLNRHWWVAWPSGHTTKHWRFNYVTRSDHLRWRPMCYLDSSFFPFLRVVVTAGDPAWGLGALSPFTVGGLSWERPSLGAGCPFTGPIGAMLRIGWAPLGAAWKAGWPQVFTYGEPDDVVICIHRKCYVAW